MIDIYLAAPYSNYSPEMREWIFRTVSIVAAHYMENGKTVISPLTHGHPIAKYGAGITYDTWQAVDLAMLSICREMHVLCFPGIEFSEGINRETIFCRENNIPIVEIKTIAGLFINNI